MKEPRTIVLGMIINGCTDRPNKFDQVVIERRTSEMFSKESKADAKELAQVLWSNIPAYQFDIFFAELNKLQNELEERYCK